jgi:ATP-dependent RNA helicase RhlE
VSQSFKDLGVSAPVVRALASRDIRVPFRIQTLVLPDALAGLDVVAESPTGSGKTLAFALPIVERSDASDRRPTALVLVPTRELAVQVAEDLSSVAPAKGLRVAAVYGGTPLAGQARRTSDAHVLVATPGRLQDLVRRGSVSLAHVRILVLDEADRMLDMGFRPQVDDLVRRMPTARQTMLFSATLAGNVDGLVHAYTANPVRIEAARQARAVVPVAHRFLPVTRETKLDALVEVLAAAEDLALVFVRTKRGADRLARALSRRDVAAAALHGDMSQGARERALGRFRSGAVRTLVATDVAARGLDLDRITDVVNYDPPQDDDGYLHRVGRTGRAGCGGTGTTLVLPDQQDEVGRVARRLGYEQEFTREGMRMAPPRLVYSSRRGSSRPRTRALRRA